MFVLLIFPCISLVLAQYNGPAMPVSASGYEKYNEIEESPHSYGAVDQDQLAYQSQTEEIEGMMVVPRPIVPVHDSPLTASDLAHEIVDRFGCSKTSEAKVKQYIGISRPTFIGKASSVVRILQKLCKAQISV
ncbi:unnamed protein product [Auanema sp. JU1783]|nr:unnamed protein product [Auanema sp. JU1783]